MMPIRRSLLASFASFACITCFVSCAGGLSPLTAQTPHQIARLGNAEVVSFTPDCNPLQKRFDPVWVNGWGWTMPRVGWHVMYPTLNYGIAKSLTAVGVNRKVAAIGATLGLGLIPHVRQAALGLKHGAVYELNAPDWIFDLWNRSLPSWDMLAHDEHSAKEYGVWVAGDLALSCFASP